jgi:hypothetical protein
MLTSRVFQRFTHENILRPQLIIFLPQQRFVSSLCLRLHLRASTLKPELHLTGL